MTSFSDRERAFESKFALDADLQFRVTARRNKLLGLWAAAALGKTGAEADAYAAEVVKSDFQEAGDDDVLRKVSGDLGGKFSDADIRAKMTALLLEAKAQFSDEA